MVLLFRHLQYHHGINQHTDCDLNIGFWLGHYGQCGRFLFYVHDCVYIAEALYTKQVTIKIKYTILNNKYIYLIINNHKRVFK